MLWILACHIIFVVCWFAGIFYLPRLFVYHAMAEDKATRDQFKIMERKLYYGITTPSGVLTTIFGVWLYGLNPSYYHAAIWMHCKLALVACLWIYHGFCYHYLKVFKADKNIHSHQFYRWFNEVPVLILTGVVLLVVVKPWG